MAGKDPVLPPILRAYVEADARALDLEAGAPVRVTWRQAESKKARRKRFSGALRRAVRGRRGFRLPGDLRRRSQPAASVA